MPRSVYWELFYHVVWRTKDSAPMLTASLEPLVHNYLKLRALQTTGAIVHAIGGIEDHVHLALTLPPSVSLGSWIGDLKGASAHQFNHGPHDRKTLAWQSGYGVVSFGKRDLPWVVNYVANQREHHRSGSAEDRLERIEQPEGRPTD